MDEVKIDAAELMGDGLEAVPPADLARMWNMVRVTVAAVALAGALLLTFAQRKQTELQSNNQLQTTLDARAIQAERDQAITERNQAIAELEELRAGTPATGSDAVTLRLSSYLAGIDQQAGQARALLGTSPDPQAQQAATQIDAMRATIAQAQGYIAAGSATPSPGPTPSAYFPDEGVARMIPASLTSEPAPAPPPPPAALSRAAQAAGEARFMAMLAVLLLLGVAFLAAAGLLLLSRAEATQRWTSEAVKIFCGLFVGIALTLFVAG